MDADVSILAYIPRQLDRCDNYLNSLGLSFIIGEIRMIIMSAS